VNSLKLRTHLVVQITRNSVKSKHAVSNFFRRLLSDCRRFQISGGIASAGAMTVKEGSRGTHETLLREVFLST
jgi:hypothetical protein